MTHRLHSQLYSSRTNKILVLARYSNIEVEHKVLSSPADLSSESIQQLNPNRKIPILETPRGTLHESNAIVRYFARNANLYGETLYEQGVVDQWLDWELTELEPPLHLLLAQVNGWVTINPEQLTNIWNDLHKSLKILDNFLLKHTFLSGYNITAADISLASTLWTAFALLFDEHIRKQYPSITRWFNTVSYQPHFVNVWGNRRLYQGTHTKTK